MCIYIYIYVIMKTMCPPGYHHNTALLQDYSVTLLKYYILSVHQIYILLLFFYFSKIFIFYIFHNNEK